MGENISASAPKSNETASLATMAAESGSASEGLVFEALIIKNLRY